MTEHEQPQHTGLNPPAPGATPANAGIWDPAEQVGDIYEVEMDEQGHVVQADRLSDDPDEGDDPNARETQPRLQPRIWVGSWADYNNGVLHGAWIAADRDDPDVWADIQTMLARSPTAAATGDVAEDWGIFDHENFGSLRVGEQESVAWVAKVARGIAAHGPAYAAWAEIMDDDELLGGFEDAYLGYYDSVDSYAEQLVGDHGYDVLLDQALPEGLRRYVRLDTTALAGDLIAGGDVYAVPADHGGVWLFDTRA